MAAPTTRAQDQTRIRDAATVILARNPDRPEILMGRRGAGAAFMPNKMVFPGGAVDVGDGNVPLSALPAEPCMTRLAEDSAPHIPRAAIAAAIREVWEETGLILGTPDTWQDPPADWEDFAATGHRPTGAGLRFVFRAITPPGRPRRFDARFFLADVGAVQGDASDFSRASDELSALQWVPLAEMRRHDLPFITQVVLAEVAALIGTDAPPATVPFFRNDDEESLFLRLRGTAPQAQD
ncbi:NUDIX domain-containing protein [Meridianimarinicoccus aquatilis]|uniref:NUDIX hydrolase n=1 Tax=Meridianimarinicoccus aquatilis TaxID=2552766 RepID=A0A4R6AVX0_9RHOB|nr:NUDIX hydrolase [Fluviibacterium aquatile]TDL87825.1 NUDIX hydrolase [Fluviibacterium aquatile]